MQHPAPANHGHPASISPAACEERSLQRLWGMVKEHAPYLEASFIYEEAWWNRHRGLPEAHMFKYLLIRGMQDLRYVFDAAPAVSPEEIKTLLESANSSVRDVWEDKEASFQERMETCAKAVGPVIDMNAQGDVGEFRKVPKGVPDSLGRAFNEFYSGEDLLLVGRADKYAYRVQELYASRVEEMVAGSRRSRSRVVTRLGKAYGQNSMPLLSMSSAAGLWRLCCSPFYKRILSLLHRWMEPFAGAHGMDGLGCSYIPSIHNFLKPVPGKRTVVFTQFYSSIMMLSTELYIVAMLDDYVAPNPTVAGFVRNKLIRHESSMAVQWAVQRHRNSEGALSDDFHQDCLSYSGLNFDGGNPAVADAISSDLLYGHLFDLGLGHYVKASKIRCYTEFHSVRSSISWLISEWVESKIVSPDVNFNRLWWDAHYKTEHLPHAWISLPLGDHPGFYAVFDSWFEDSGHLQNWLEGYERNTAAVNNPKGVDRVFSESVAIKALELAELEGDALDHRRRAASKDLPDWLFDECERLGLFRTRMPRFTQLFFYDFTREEQSNQVGQFSATRSAKRAASAYLCSGKRLESTCGISEIWYEYVEDNRCLFEKKREGHTVKQEPRYPYDRIDRFCKENLLRDLEWQQMHSRPEPTPKACILRYFKRLPKNRMDRPTKDASPATSSHAESAEDVEGAGDAGGAEEAEEAEDFEEVEAFEEVKNSGEVEEIEDVEVAEAVGGVEDLEEANSTEGDVMADVGGASIEEDVAEIGVTKDAGAVDTAEEAAEADVVEVSALEDHKDANALEDHKDTNALEDHKDANAMEDDGETLEAKQAETLSEFEFGSWPEDPSFAKALGDHMDGIEGGMADTLETPAISNAPHGVIDEPVPSSIPEDRGFHLHPVSARLAADVAMDDLVGNPEEGLATECVESAVSTGEVGPPSGEVAEGGDGQPVSEEEVEYATDVYTMAAHRPSKAERENGLAKLLDSRRARNSGR